MSYLTNKSWWGEKIHVSWFIAWLSFGLLVGVGLSPITGDYFVSGAWLLLALALLLASLVKRLRYWLLIVLLAGVLVGLWRGAGYYVDVSRYTDLIGQSVILSGRVNEDTSAGKNGNIKVRLSDVRINETKLPSTVWVSLAEPADIRRGDEVVVKGMLAEGFGNIPASVFRAEIIEISRPHPGDIGRQIRDWFGVGVSRAMPAEDASLAMGFLVGQKITVNELLLDQLRTVGLIHAVVASGYHLTVLVGVVRRLFHRISKYLSTLLSGAMIGGFIMITGLSPSMTRAGLVTGLSLWAWYYGRVIHPLVLLPFAAAITVLFQPAYLWGDVGWYLSFASFAGIVLGVPLIKSYFWGNSSRGWVREVLLATFAAQLLTLPITIYFFGYFSAYALLANLLVVPLVPLVMLLTFIAGSVGLVAPSLAPIFGYPVRLILWYMKVAVDWVANLPGAKTELAVGVVWLVLGYIIIGLLLFYLWRKTKYDFRQDDPDRLL